MVFNWLPNLHLLPNYKEYNLVVCYMHNKNVVQFTVKSTLIVLCLKNPPDWLYMLFKLKSVVTSLTCPAVTSVSNKFNKIQRSVFIGTVDQFPRLLKHM